jgi:hypothetical protein
LIEASRHDGWTVTQAGDTLAIATAARPVSRQTAERALAQFLERVRLVAHLLDEMTRERGTGWPHFHVVDVTIQGLLQTEDEFCHATNADFYFIGRVRPAHIHGLRVTRQLDLAETSRQESEWTFLRVADDPLRTRRPHPRVGRYPST